MALRAGDAERITVYAGIDPRRMSLQRKFIVLLALLGLTVLGSLSAAIWAFDAQHRALVGPFEGTPALLEYLSQIQDRLTRVKTCLRADEIPNVFLQDADNAIRAKWDERGAKENDPTTKSKALTFLAGEEFNRHADQIVQQLKVVDDSDLYIASGASTPIRAMATRFERVRQVAPDWFQKGSVPAKAEALSLTDRLSDLAVQIQRRLLEDWSQGIDYSNAIVRQLLVVLLSATASSLLLSVLALVLLRRWVLRPVSNLRAAAAHIAQGHFEHQIPVRGRDEIAQLSLEVNHMALTIRRMLDERVERERLAALGEMVRRLAHSLRNPLSGIRGLAELTRNDLLEGSELRENQDRILKAVDRFEKWLSDLLNATRPLEVQLAPMEMHAFVAHLMDTHRAMADSRDVVLELDMTGAPERVVCDAAQLEHAVVSILTNAIQASPRAGRVAFRAILTNSGESWEIRISDQGPGVPDELKEKVFLPYFTTKKDGSGIGLAIAQQVVRGHNGTITIEPGLGTNKVVGAGPGSTFVIRLPITPVGG